MRILHIIDNLEFTGGAQKWEKIFAEALAPRNLDFTVVSLKVDHGSPIADSIRDSGARVVYFPGKSLVDPARFWRLFMFVRREAFDVVHTHLPFANILGTTAAALNGVPVVTTLHNERIKKRRYYALKSGVETFLLRSVTTRVIACSNAAAEAQARRLAGKPIVTIPNAVEISAPITNELRQAIRTQLAGDVSYPLIITVGRLTHQKGYEDLLTAFAEVSRNFPEAKLLIVGGGELHQTLQDRITAFGLDRQVMLLGLRKDVPQLLAASDLYVNSSLWEGLSIAMLEAMAAGLPVVATSVGDAPRVVLPGHGILVPPRQPDQLADALCTMLADPEKITVFGAAARRYVLTHHHPEKWADKTVDLYLSITGCHESV